MFVEALTQVRSVQKMNLPHIQLLPSVCDLLVMGKEQDLILCPQAPKGL
jgi:hypothetical protein